MHVGSQEEELKRLLAKANNHHYHNHKTEKAQPLYLWNGSPIFVINANEKRWTKYNRV